MKISFLKLRSWRASPMTRKQSWAVTEICLKLFQNADKETRREALRQTEDFTSQEADQYIKDHIDVYRKIKEEAYIKHKTRYHALYGLYAGYEDDCYEICESSVWYG